MTQETDVLIPRDDETEALLVKQMSGVGDVILDDYDVKDYALEGYGINFGRDDR